MSVSLLVTYNVTLRATMSKERHIMGIFSKNGGIMRCSGKKSIEIVYIQKLNDILKNIFFL